MKKIVTLLGCIIVAAGAQAQSGRATIVRISDTPKKKPGKVVCKDPAMLTEYYAECAKHKHHEVEISRTAMKGGHEYEINYYQKERDTMRSHAFSIGPEALYDRAEYTWDHDTVAVRFFEKNNKMTKAYRGFGLGNASSMFMDD